LSGKDKERGANWLPLGDSASGTLYQFISRKEAKPREAAKRTSLIDILFPTFELNFAALREIKLCHY
jgi:hypothetical protein